MDQATLLRTLRQVEQVLKREVLPESRARTPQNVLRGPGGNWVRIFCANCGAPGGLVPAENMTFTFWLCDVTRNGCYEKFGAIAGTMAIPDEVFWARVQAERAERARLEGAIRGVLR